MAEVTQVRYVGDNATHAWLCHLATLPGAVWVEFRGNEMAIVHEFEDQRSGDVERQTKAG